MKIFVIFLLFFSLCYGQNLKVDELKFLDFEEKYNLQFSQTDSLKDQLNSFLEELEKVKKNEPENKDKISSMMAHALELSNRIDQKEKKLFILEKQLKNIRRNLYQKYTSRIDSLQELSQNSVQNPMRNESELKELINKRLYVSPLLTELSFDPRLIEKIKLSESQDEKEKKIYKEYLNNALNEVDSNIVNLHEKGENVREVFRLNEKTEDFMDDVAADQISGALVVRGQDLQRTAEDMLFSDPQNMRVNEMASLNKIYNRLSPYIYENMDFNEYSLQDTIYTDDYLKLLEETEKTLRLYREKIKDKLR